MARAKATKDDEKQADATTAGSGGGTATPDGAGAGEAEDAGATEDTKAAAEPVSFADRYGKYPEIPETDPRGEPPQRRGGGAKTGSPMEVPAIRSVLDETHLGIVNSRGEPLDLARALVKEAPRSKIWHATERIFESSTMPGSDRPRMRLIVAEGGVVSDADYEALTDALTERTAGGS